MMRVSAALAAAQAVTAAPVRFPGDDGGRSLAEMAQRDLDAALQLLADRAQYITGASGAAIALRRDGRNDMLCRASAGENAPELGALLSTEFGLSGESVRTKRPLRCDDAERDARVNREVCRQLGIASVVVMPVVNDDQVLGVFELFSGKANAFGERDLSAVQRLSEMVETAVRMAHATATATEKIKERESSVAETVHSEVFEGQFLSDLVVEEPLVAAPEIPSKQDAVAAVDAVEPAAAVANEALKKEEPKKEESEKDEPKIEAAATPVAAAPAVKKPLFWSAAVTPETETPATADLDQSNVPPVLRSLRKCEACGFPVTAGRVLCVECEEKKWRGQLRPSARKPVASVTPPVSPSKPGGFAAAAAPSMAKATTEISPAAPSVLSPASAEAVKPAEPAKVESAAALVSSSPAPEFVLSAGLEPSQSWLSRNKYVLIALLVTGGGVAGYFLLR